MLRLRDIMTPDVVTVSPELTVRDAMNLLAASHVSGAPVVSTGKVVGVISATDLLGFAASLPGVPEERLDQLEWGEWASAGEPGEKEGDQPAATYFTELWEDAGTEIAERFEEVTGPEWNVLEEHTVDEAMTNDVRALPAGTEVPAAADFMRRAGIHRVLVMDGNRLLGIVSATDIAKAVAEHQLTSPAYVFNRDRDFDERGWLPSNESSEA